MERRSRISRNFVRGKPIDDPFTLIKLAKHKMSVYHIRYGIKPAAFIIGMQFNMVMGSIIAGRLFETIKKPIKDKVWYLKDKQSKEKNNE